MQASREGLTFQYEKGRYPIPILEKMSLDGGPAVIMGKRTAQSEFQRMEERLGEHEAAIGTPPSHTTYRLSKDNVLTFNSGFLLKVNEARAFAHAHRPLRIHNSTCIYDCQ